jgi:hypothetical protein
MFDVHCSTVITKVAEEILLLITKSTDILRLMFIYDAQGTVVVVILW